MTATRQLDLFGLPPERPYLVPPTSRLEDPDTSIAAGEPNRGTDRHTALIHLRSAGPRGLTDFELADLMVRQQTSAGKRRLELQRNGLCEDSGERRAAPSGSMAIVWRITTAGRRGDL